MIKKKNHLSLKASAQMYCVAEKTCLEHCVTGQNACFGLHLPLSIDTPQCPFAPPPSQAVQKEKTWLKPVSAQCSQIITLRAKNYALI